MTTRMLTVSVIVLAPVVVIGIIGAVRMQIQTTYAAITGGELVPNFIRDGTSNTIITGRAVPLAISGNNIYVA